MTAQVDIGSTFDLLNYDSYLIKSEQIPFIERERDYTPIVSNYKFSISSASPNTPKYDDDVRVIVDSKVVFGGRVKKITYDYDTRLYDIEAVSTLDLLKTKMLNPTNVHPLISATADLLKYNDADATTYTGDTVNLHYVTVLHLLEQLFTDVGLSLDTTAAQNSFIYFSELETFQVERLLLDEKNMYLFTTPTSDDELSVTTDGEIYKYRNSLTYWDLISELCSCIGCIISRDTTNDIYAYTLSRFINFQSNKFQFSAGDLYSPTDSQKYSYKTETIYPENSLMNSELKIDIWDNSGTKTLVNPAYTRIAAYIGLGGAPHYINKTVDVDYTYNHNTDTKRDKNIITPWEQFIMYGAIQAGSPGSEYLTTDYATGGRAWIPSTIGTGSYTISPLFTKTYPKLYPYTRIELEKPVDVTTKECLTHFIDLDKQTSLIKYEYQP